MSSIDNFFFLNKHFHTKFPLAEEYKKNKIIVKITAFISFKENETYVCKIIDFDIGTIIIKEEKKNSELRYISYDDILSITPVFEEMLKLI